MLTVLTSVRAVVPLWRAMHLHSSTTALSLSHRRPSCAISYGSLCWFFQAGLWRFYTYCKELDAFTSIDRCDEGSFGAILTSL
jgi:hypothetical protein